MISKEEREYQKARIKFILQDFLFEEKEQILLLCGKTEHFREAYMEMNFSIKSNTKIWFLKEYFSEIVCCFNESKNPDILLNDVRCLIWDGLWEVHDNWEYHHSLMFVFGQIMRFNKMKIILVYEGDMNEILWMLKRYIPYEAVLKIEVR